MASNTAALRVGRLLEIRVDAGYRTPEQVDALFDSVVREVSRLPSSIRHITVVDWRRCPVMSPAAVERIAARIVATNAQTERSAALADADAPVAVLQFLRVIRDAGLEDRKLFFDEQQLTQWLQEILTPQELTRLRQFLVETKTI